MIPVKELGHIVVIMGGCSSEKDISLKSGQAVFQALQERGCRVSDFILSSEKEEDIIPHLQKMKPDVVFIALHGRFGEDGRIQSILEKIDIPYTGSGPQASRWACHKITAQSLFHKNGIPVPPGIHFTNDHVPSLKLILKKTGGWPVVVKPSSEGSSIGVSVISDQTEWPAAIKKAFEYGPEILVERYIQGREITAGILKDRALPLIEIKHQNLFFDFQTKYHNSTTEYLIPAQLPLNDTRRIQETALMAFYTLGCRDFGRVDFMIDQKSNPFVMEINTIPGFTSSSLLPKAAKCLGIDFPDLCLQLIQGAYLSKIEPLYSTMRSSS